MSVLIVLHGVRTVQLSRGLNALIDEADWAAASLWTWHATNIRRPGQTPHRKCYAKTNKPSPSRGSLFLHNLILSPPCGLFAGHRNRDTLDNRRANLRLCTAVENSRNRHGLHRTSKYKGVHYEKDRRKWTAMIHVWGKTKFIGRYDDEKEAAAAYDRAAIHYFGRFSATNAELQRDF